MSEPSLEFEQKCKRLWESEVDIIAERFGLTPSFPERFLLSDDDLRFNKYQLGKIIDEKLWINSKLPGLNTLLPLVIAKLCLQSSLPNNLLCEECINDFSFEYAWQRAKEDSLKKQWQTLWKMHSPPRELFSVMKYDPSTDYRTLYFVVGESGLDTIIKELTIRVRDQVPLSLEDYLLYFSTRVRKFETKLTRTELKIINHLLKTPDIHVTALSKAVELSTEWVSRKLTELKKRRLFRKFDRVPFSRVGIQMFHVMLEKMSSKEDSFDLLKECPLLYSFRRVVSGSWSTIITLCIPENDASMKYATLGLQHVAEHGFNVDVFQIKSSGVSHCFDYYNVKAGQWEIPWELLTVNLRRISLDGLASAIPRVDSPASRTHIHLTELEIKILNCVWRGFNSVSSIRSELKVSQQRVADSLKVLRDEKLIVTSWEVHSVGLTEHVVVYEKNHDTALSISGWAQRLPRTIISFSETGELLLIPALPKGGSYGIAAAIGEVSSDSRIAVLGPMMYGSWGFPVELWDHEFQRWKCPEKELEEWISGLR